MTTEGVVTSLRSCRIFCASRVSLSLLPPGAVGTMNSTGFSGRHDDWPHAAVANEVASDSASARAARVRTLPDELVDEALAQADGGVVRARLFQAGEDIFVAVRDALRIDVHQAAVHLEQRDHLGAALGHDQGVGLARRLEDVAAFLGHPEIGRA